MVSQRLRHTPLSSTATLTSQSSTCTLPRTTSSPSTPLHNRSNPSSPLGLSSPSSSSSFSSSSFSSSSSTTSSKHQKKKKEKKRARRSLAEEQELHRIMDPTYLSKPSSNSSSSSSKWNEYHPDPEGHWHDIDYKPFMRIKENVNAKQRCFGSSSFSSTSSSGTTTASASGESSESESVFGCRREDQRPRVFGKKKSKARERVAYWETFTTTVFPFDMTPSSEIRHFDDGDGSEYQYPCSAQKSSPLPASYYHQHYSYPVDTSIDGDDCEGGEEEEEEEEETDTRRVLLKKKKKKGSLDSLTSSASSSSPSPSSSSPPSSSEAEEATEDIPRKGRKAEPQPFCPKSKNEFYKKWATTRFIARLKVIRTKRWLKDRALAF